jgi:hypothetical protein
MTISLFAALLIRRAWSTIWPATLCGSWFGAAWSLTAAALASPAGCLAAAWSTYAAKG